MVNKNWRFREALKSLVGRGSSGFYELYQSGLPGVHAQWGLVATALLWRERKEQQARQRVKPSVGLS